MKTELKTPIQVAGFDAYWNGDDDDPVSACPYDELTTRGKRLEWIHGWCVAHAEAEDAVKESA